MREISEHLAHGDDVYLVGDGAPVVQRGLRAVKDLCDLCLGRPR